MKNGKGLRGLAEVVSLLGCGQEAPPSSGQSLGPSSGSRSPVFIFLLNLSG